jgi:hypothetical protein
MTAYEFFRLAVLLVFVCYLLQFLRSLLGVVVQFLQQRGGSDG